MEKQLSSIIRKIFLGSIAGIASANPGYAVEIPDQLKSANNNVGERLILNNNQDLTPKLLLKQTDTDEWAFMAHRSHRSHSSHRSHYSSSSGGTTTPARTNPGLQSGTPQRSTTAPANTDQIYVLGSRILKKGMSGSDVTELVNILLKKSYLKLEDGGTTVTGILTFDEIVENAVKEFQKDNGLTADGICGTTTIYKLKNN